MSDEAQLFFESVVPHVGVVCALHAVSPRDLRLAEMASSREHELRAEFPRSLIFHERRPKMELRLAVGPPRPDRPAVIRLRDGLTIGRHPKPIPKPGDEGPCSCTPGCKFCEEKNYADVRIGDLSSLPGLIGRLHARVALDDNGALWLHHLSELGRTRVGDKMLKANKSQRLTEGCPVIFGANGSESEYAYVCRPSMELRLTTTSLEWRPQFARCRPHVVHLYDGLTIGRAEQMDCQLDTTDPDLYNFISRRHARIRLQNNEFILDNFSVNQTKVGERNLRESKSAVLTEGALVIFGSRGSKREFAYICVRSDAPPDYAPPPQPHQPHQLPPPQALPQQARSSRQSAEAAAASAAAPYTGSVKSRAMLVDTAGQMRARGRTGARGSGGPSFGRCSKSFSI
jgi:hypothetical protein